MELDIVCKKILNIVGIYSNDVSELEGIFFSREELLSEIKYQQIKEFIPELKKNFSSSFMTSMQKNAGKNQKWPLINLVRQILSVYSYHLSPVRKCDGYTSEGVKKYKRFFKIIKKFNYSGAKNNEIINKNEINEFNEINDNVNLQANNSKE
jgi:hypothetical protein